ncbi:MAG: cytochrome c3 family protein [Gammaproteobacteria bacterium]|nr:cytochrome c3 family protein [Gammaproteobacteria bacterium]MDH5651762.1 cytochrome c3 family protein [Gammaproteobacteria bacterium]
MIWAVTGAAVILLSGFSMPSQAGIVNSAHDFSGQSWSGGKICVACHTPHGSNTDVVDAPLWNRQSSVATYTLYSSPSLKVAPVQPRGPSKLCLSCHDGTIALDNFGGAGSGTTHISGNRNLGTDLSNDHPISVEWRHQTVDTSSDFCFNCHFGPPRELVFFRPGGSGPIWVECATCHDVHNNVGNPKLLRRSLANSELCMTCHEK